MGRLGRRHIVIIGFAVLLGLGYLFPHGFFPFSAGILYPIWFQVLLFLVLAGSVFAPHLPELDLPEGRRRWLVVAGVSVFSGILLAVFYQNNSLIGDTAQLYAKIREFPTETSWEQNRLFSLGIYYFLSKVMSWGMSIWNSIIVLHIVLGGIWAGIVVLTAMETAGKKWLYFAGIVALSGGLLLFDHIEVYAIPMIFEALFFLFLFKLKGRWGFVLTIVVGLLAGMFHPLLLFLPVVAVIHRIRGMKNAGLISALVFFVGLGLTIVLDMKLSLSGKRDIFLFITQPEYFASWEHIRISLCFLFLSGPALLYVIVGGVRKMDIGLVFGGGVSIVILLLLDFMFAGGDRDLVALIFYPVLLAGGFSAVRAGFSRTAFWLSTVFMLMLLPLRLSYGLEVERADQLMNKQDTPYFLTEFPAGTMICFRTSMDFLQTKDRSLLPYIKRYGVEAMFDHPEDTRGYTYCAAAFDFEGNNAFSAAVFLRGFLHSSGPKSMMENTIKTHVKAGKGRYFPLGYPAAISDAKLDSLGAKPLDKKHAGNFAGSRRVKQISSNHFILESDVIPIHVNSIAEFVTVLAPIPTRSDLRFDDFLCYAWNQNRKLDPLVLFISEGGAYLGVSLRSSRGIPEFTAMIEEKAPKVIRDIGDTALVRSAVASQKAH